MDDTIDAGDHRRLGRELGLFATHPDIGAGLPMWLPRGAAVRAALEHYVVEEERRAGYVHVVTPQLAKRSLYGRSGHWEHYAEDMFPPMRLGGDSGGDGDELVLRPMNCPHHALVYAAETRSWRDLPLRIAELGTLYRSERSGVLGGLSRTRAFTLPDAHIFCAADQVESELATALAMTERAYAALGITGHRYRLSLRVEQASGKYHADEELWQRAEAALRAALIEHAVAFEDAPGEAAFYGPKIDIQVSDHRGRESTLSTVQLDYLMAERFDLSYAAADGRPHRPVVIHRGVIGSLERVVAHLTEVHAGAFPLWLAPVQAVVLPVEAAQAEHAHALVDWLVSDGGRVELDASDRSLGARVRLAQRARVPVMAVVGACEAADGTVALRLRDGRREAGVPVEGLRERLRKAVASHTAELPGSAHDP